MRGGYVGKLLRVNLTNRMVRDEPLPDEATLRKYIGGTGLATKILYDEVPPHIQASDPANRIVFMTGPLTGTPAPSSSNTTIASLHWDLPYASGNCHIHGVFGAYLKFAGYDGIIIEGAASEPVWLAIHDGQATLHDAGQLWGKDIRETQDLVKEELGEPEASVAAIGPAGENLLRGASLRSDYNHTGAKGGIGAVMGSKKLKAVAVYGRKRGIKLADPKALLDVGLEWRHNLMHNCKGPASLLMDGGITTGLSVLGELYMAAVKNLSDPEFGMEYGQALVDLAKTSKVTARPCINCPIGCPYDFVIGDGPYKGYVMSNSGGAENMEGLGGMTGCKGGAALMLTDLCDRLGFDSAEPGIAIALAIEAYQRGSLTKERTGGLELRWGDAETVAVLLRMIVHREGFGAVLAQGVGKTAEYIGGDAAQWAVHVKGVGPNIHDWRVAWQALLGQAVSNAGPVIEGQGVDAFAAEPDLGFQEKTPRFDHEAAPDGVRKTAVKKMWEDCIGTCWFGSEGVVGSTRFEPQAVSAAVGWEFTPEEAALIGERIMQLQRVFNLRRGLKPDMDLDVGPRLLAAPTAGPAKDHPVGPHFRDMVMDYYELLGWDKETGRPTQETLSRVGLEELIPDVWPQKITAR